MFGIRSSQILIIELFDSWSKFADKHNVTLLMWVLVFYWVIWVVKKVKILIYVTEKLASRFYSIQRDGPALVLGSVVAQG